MLEQKYMADVVYDGNDVINIWAPVSADGGVDFSKLQKYEELRQKIKIKLKISDFITQIIRVYGDNS